jgi:large subunit ribosomal protein L32
MAVPKRRTTRASRDKRRSHHALSLPSIMIDKDKKVRLRYFVDQQGMYRGKKIFLQSEKDKK